MKKLLVVGVLALSAVLLSRQDASAWVNTRFGIGLNWSYQSGGNNFLWGAFRNSQPPGPEYGSVFPGPGYGPAYHGHAYAPAVTPAPVYASPVDATPEPPYAPVGGQTWNYNGSNYQTVTFPSPYAMPYYYPASYYYFGR